MFSKFLAPRMAPRMASRMALGMALSMAFLLLVLSLAPVHAQNVRPPGNAVNLEEVAGPPNTLGSQSDSDFWRAFRGDAPLDRETIMSGPIEGQVMSRTGEPWRKLRTEYIGKYAIYFPAGVIAILLLYYLLRGKMMIEGGRAGKTLPRFSLGARVAHWFMAVIFILLGLSGLIILLARAVLVPLLGSQVTAVLASAALQAHNLFGPVFVLALVWMFIKFVRGNVFQLIDIKWILKLGGMLGGHVSSRQFNFGEKSWFWMVMLVGLVMSVTGLALAFPWLFGDIRVLQLSTVLHGIGAVALISVAIGHIYVGSIGMEGSIDGMLKGEVDENWAKAHHDLWYEEVTGKSAQGEKDKP